MANDWAAEHLQTIRTLMERSAVYRRALAPIMMFAGTLGTAAAGIGFLLGDQGARFFVLYWLGVAGIGVFGALVLVRRQAFRDAEPFWSPPTRRVAAAMAPALFVGAVLAAVVPPDWAPCYLPPLWMALYGCSLHAAGFFMPRGIRIFGWIFVVGGSALLALNLLCSSQLPGGLQRAVMGGHLPMGVAFGLLHLAYGIYLYFTEKRGNET